jgi:hypothetical protein
MTPHTAYSSASTGSAVVGDRRAARRRTGMLPAAILALGILGQLVASLYWTRDGWLGVDGLYYISSRGGLTGEHTSIFAPYAGHWQPVLISMYLVLWWIFGLHSYLPYVLPAILTHLAICVLLYVILRRLGIGPWVALVPVWALLWFGVGGESWLMDAPFALTAPVALGLVAVYLLVRRPDAVWARWVACGLATLGLGISATGFVVVLLLGLFTLGAWGLRASLRVALLPAVVFVVWFLVSGRTGGRVHVSSDDLLSAPRNALSVLVLPLGDVVAISSAGAILTLAVVATTLLVRVDSAILRALAIAGIGAAAAQTCFSVVANADLGFESWSVGRYRYVVLVMLVPAFALSLDVAVRRARDVLGPTRVAVAALAVLGLVAVTVNGIDTERGQADFAQAVSARFKTYMRGTMLATDLGERMLTTEVPGLYIRGQDMVRLADPEIRSELSIGKPDAEDRVQTENQMYVGVGPETFTMPAPAKLDSADFDRPLSQEFGCETYDAKSSTPFVTMSSFDGAQIAVTSHSHTIRTRLVREGLEPEPRAWAVTPGETVYIATSAELAELQVFFDAGGEFKICRA